MDKALNAANRKEAPSVAGSWESTFFLGKFRAVHTPLCVGLLDEGAPELVVVPGPEVDEAVVAGGQAVVDHNLVPLAEPESQLCGGIMIMN